MNYEHLTISYRLTHTRYEIPATSHERRATDMPSTSVGSPLPITPLFMQNKANFKKAQMNVTKVSTRNYENIRLHERCENKPNQTQFVAAQPLAKPEQSQFPMFSPIF